MIEADNYQNVARKATRGLAWNYVSFGGSKLLNLVTISILAHLLSPGNFGIVALATLTIDYLSILNDLGLGAALIQRKENVEEAANTAFTMNLAAGAVLSLASFVAAPLVAAFFHEPMVTPILRWLGLTFFINAFGSVHYVRLQKEMNFQKRLVSEMGNSTVKAAVSIGMALAGFQVWALVFGQLAGVFTSVVILWIIFPWRPQLSWDSEIAKNLFKYGSPVMGNNALSILEDSFDYVLIGRFYNSAALGIYTLAYRLPELLVINVLWVMTAVLFPTFASLQDQHESLKRSFLSIVRYVELIVTPICIGLFIAADPIIRVVFGEQWVDAIPILRILAIYALVVSIGFHVGDVYKAIGRPEILIKTSLPIFVIRVIALWIGAQYGLVWVAVGHLVAGMIGITIRLIVTARILGIAPLDIARELIAFVGGAALLALTLPTLYLTQNSLPLIRLVSVIVVGGLGYLSAIWLLERNSLKDAIRLISNSVS